MRFLKDFNLKRNCFNIFFIVYITKMDLFWQKQLRHILVKWHTNFIPYLYISFTYTKKRVTFKETGTIFVFIKLFIEFLLQKYLSFKITKLRFEASCNQLRELNDKDICKVSFLVNSYVTIGFFLETFINLNSFYHVFLAMIYWIICKYFAV